MNDEIKTEVKEPEVQEKAARKPRAAAKPAAKRYFQLKSGGYPLTSSSGVRFFPGSPVLCDDENWLECQMKAGLIEEVEV